MRPYIFIVDTETTGKLRYGQTPAIIEIGGLMLTPDLEVIETFHDYLAIPPGTSLQPGAMKIHADKGLDLHGMNARGKDPSYVYGRLYSLFEVYRNRAEKNVVLAGHNVGAFDKPFLIADAQRHGFDLETVIDYHSGLDTSVMAMERYVYGDASIESPSLRYLAPRLGFTYDKGKAHGAMYDVALTLDCLRAMMQGG